MYMVACAYTFSSLLKMMVLFLLFPIICVQNIRQGRFKINYDAQHDNDKKMLHQLCVYGIFTNRLEPGARFMYVGLAIT